MRKSRKELESTIFDLEYSNNTLKATNNTLTAANEALKKQLNGERVCGNHCAVCENSIAHETHMPYFDRIHTEYKCLLDCKCKDFKRVEPLI